MTGSLDRLVPRSEAKRVAGVKADSTIWRWERLGLFPRRRTCGRNKIGYLESELREWLEQRVAVQ